MTFAQWVVRTAKVGLALGVLLQLGSEHALAQTLYSDIWNDDANAAEELPLHGIGVSDDSWGGFPQRVDTTLYNENNQAVDSSSSVESYYYVEAWVYRGMGWDVVGDAPQNCAVSFHWIRQGLEYEMVGNTDASIIPKRFRAVFKKSHHNAFIDKWVYTRQSDCVHACQGAQYCLRDEYEWIYIPGWKVAFACVAVPPWPRGSATKPSCVNPGWGEGGLYQDECDEN